MNIKNYTGYFHDGDFIGVKKKENKMEFFLQSCEILSDETIDKEILSKENTIKGKLCLKGVKWIKVDDIEDKEIPWKKYDDGEILRFRIYDNKVYFLIEWKNFPPKPNEENICTIEVEAEEIDWENIPDLPDNCCNEEKNK